MEGLESQSIHLNQEIKKIEAAWDSFVDKLESALNTIVQVGPTDSEKANELPVAVDEKQQTQIPPTDGALNLNGTLNPPFNPNGVAEGQKGGKDIMMHEEGQKSVEKTDANKSDHKLDTIYGTVEYPGATANYYIIVQDGKDTIPPVHHLAGEIPKNAKTVNTKKTSNE